MPFNNFKKLHQNEVIYERLGKENPERKTVISNDFHYCSQQLEAIQHIFYLDLEYSVAGAPEIWTLLNIN